MGQDLESRWAAHCRTMAQATYAIADHCEDPDMLARYLELAGRWLQLAEKRPSRKAVEGC